MAFPASPQPPKEIPWWKNPAIVVPCVVALAIAVVFSSKPWWTKNSPEEEKLNTPETNQGILVPEETQKVSTLRKLEPLETGKDISKTANGTYFFTLHNAVIYYLTMKDYELTTSNKRYEGASFEIQKIDGEGYLIGFVSDQDYAELGQVDSDHLGYALLFPSKNTFAQKVISIPLKSIPAIKERVVELDDDTKVYALEMNFSAYKSDPEVHFETFINP